MAEACRLACPHAGRRATHPPPTPPASPQRALQVFAAASCGCMYQLWTQRQHDLFLAVTLISTATLAVARSTLVTEAAQAAGGRHAAHRRCGAGRRQTCSLAHVPWPRQQQQQQVVQLERGSQYGLQRQQTRRTVRHLTLVPRSLRRSGQNSSSGPEQVCCGRLAGGRHPVRHGRKRSRHGSGSSRAAAVEPSEGSCWRLRQGCR